MINNRQGGRRRGRGGQRPQNLGGQPGNRQDNRQRGNAAQLLEKYKSMARDAQLSGDRVQSEYYLQFADHYFRVLSESRARFEDQRRQRDDDGDEDEGDEELLEGNDEAQGTEARQDDGYERQGRRDRGDRGDRDGRGERSERHSRRFGRDERPAEEFGERGNGADRHPVNGESIPFDVLPPAIGRESDDSESPDDEAERPRRRARKTRSADDEDIAPAA